MLLSAEPTGSTIWDDITSSATNLGTTTEGVLAPSGKKPSASHHFNSNCPGATLVSCHIPAEKCPLSTEICSSDCLGDWSGETGHANCSGTDHCVVIECDDPSRPNCMGACHDDIKCPTTNDWLECMLCPPQGTPMDNCSQCSDPNAPNLRLSQLALNHQPPDSANVFSPFPDLVYLTQMSQSSSPNPQPQLLQQPHLHKQSFPGSRPMMEPRFSGQHLHQLKPPAYSNPLASQHVSEKARSVVCLWGACRDTFASHADLITHVNTVHLGVPPPPVSLPSVNLLPQSQHNSQHLHTTCSLQQPTLACHWGDCGLSGFQSGALSPGHQEFSSLSVLANHLLQEHLGLPLSTDIETLLGLGPASQSGTLPGVTPSLQVPQGPRATPRENSQMITSPTLADSPRMMATDIIPSPPTTASTLSPASEQTSPPSTSRQPASPPSVTPSQHKCCWIGCGQTFESVDDLSKHVVDEHVGGGKGVYSCQWEGCDRNGSKAFSSKQKILRHLQTHTGHRPFVCLTCGQHFSEAATLQQHQRRHTSEKPYVCDHPGCGKSFAVAGALTIHKRTHSGVKPFKCTYCDRAFAESSNLSKHLRTHTGVKPYVCKEPGCGKRFCRPDQLNRHRAIHTRGTTSRAQASERPEETEDVPMYDDTSLGGYTADAVNAFF